MENIENSIIDLRAEFKEKGANDNMFNRIMQEKIDGVYGRLGDLGRVPEKYDEIVTSCMGNKLDNIVVKDIEAGTAVI